MRPKYETQADRNNEQRVADLLAEKGYSLDKLPMSFGLDVAITDDFEEKIVAFAEIKARTFEMNKYPTAMINLHKVIRAHDISAWVPPGLEPDQLDSFLDASEQVHPDLPEESTGANKFCQ